MSATVYSMGDFEAFKYKWKETNYYYKPMGKEPIDDIDYLDDEWIYPRQESIGGIPLTKVCQKAVLLKYPPAATNWIPI